MTKILLKSFPGRGEVRGAVFTQLDATDKAYFYQREEEGLPTYYEVFKRKVNTQFDMEAYPKSKSFGSWAWCYVDIERARAKFDEIK